MQRRSQTSICWPTIAADIEIKVQNCNSCQRDQQRIQKEPLVLSSIPAYPWQVVSADVLHHEGRDYQVVVSHYSFFWEITYLPSLTSSSTATALWSAFQRYGYPETFRSDNATQYKNYELHNLFRKYDIVPKTSSPFFARSNGMAERAVQEAKRILKKSQIRHPRVLQRTP